MNAQSHLYSRQQGLVLVLALIVLAAMSLAAVGLMRGVLGSNRVAGNLANQQAAGQAADVGVETAIAWLEQRTQELASNAPPTPANRLYNNIAVGAGQPYAYTATRQDPVAGQSWEAFWQTLVTNNLVNTLATDAAGNRVSFVVHRLCAATGDPTVARCEASPAVPLSVQNSSKSSSIKLRQASQVYYRITVRVQGARNAASFIQAIVAI
ncbi:PilX N-terminal domain-containing pilus assembly protein [Roseateles sp. BYS87W]|uniref:PilX N-terminal domain-containing pilus assembly protein n=1 Tax=Pelomonas baiyunensis TaxID=3299026 RepID=A0ABW7GTV6_9BURK